MHSANDNATEAGAALVSDVLREIGGPLPVPPAQLAALIGLRLEPYIGAPACEPGDAVAAGYAGSVAYDAELPTPAQNRVLGFACARWLVRARGLDVEDAELVEYVACALCGLPRGPVAIVLDPGVPTPSSAAPAADAG